jgi:hypothetical protein
MYVVGSSFELLRTYLAVLFRSTLVSILSLLRYLCTETDEVDPVYAMKACKWSRVIAPLILSLGTGWRGVVKCTSQALCLWEGDAVPIEWGAGRSPALVWTLWSREKSLSTAGIRTSDR